MEKQELHRARSHFAKENRVRFAYFEDQYALNLLRHLVADGTPLRHVRKSRYGKLINRPAVKTHVAARCDGELSHDAILGIWPSDYETFWLTADEWSRDYYSRGYSQISRPGSNLVLQLNFSSRHDRQYRRLLRPVNEEHPFVFRGHPVARTAITLAWTRIDIEFATGEALIEEIQCDWLRFARKVASYWWQPRAVPQERRMLFGRVDGKVSPARLQRYLDMVLRRYERIWAEAMLWATIWVLHERMGIRTIYMHTPDTGRAFKAPVQAQPPRSLYTRLPRKFCFEVVRDPPGLLRDSTERFVARLVRQRAELPWHVLRLGRPRPMTA
ncbi:MAG: hypothetical protein OXU20_07340 [Myxococcales bacterium]|nr:hypothetical protein [Myxococcales bacterium]